FGLKKFPYDQLLWTVGMKNKEAIGSRIYLTNYRIIFKSHQFNRLKGRLSIFLPTINELRDSSFFITKKLSVGTTSSTIEFILEDVPHFIKTVKQQKVALTMEMIVSLQQDATAFPMKSSNGLNNWDKNNTITKVL
ncbi:MAG: hypothetical protein AAGK97_12630, partial [Bacteroidota bacterium]